MCKNKTFTRKELYTLVWSKPLTKLAKELSYSDNGIRKICIKHNIPLPISGYWMKLKYNKKVTKIALPKGNDDVSIEFKAKNTSTLNELHPNSERAIILKNILSNKDLSFDVPEKLIKPDLLIKETKLDLKGKKPALWDRAQGLIFTSSDVLNIEVSKPNISRALLFMDTLIKLMKKRGHTIKIDKGTYIVINDEDIKVRLREFTKRVKIEDNTSSWERYEYKASGELSFRIEDYPEKIWRDGKKSRIEEQLLKILTTLELKAKKQKEQRIANEIQRKAIELELKKEKDYKQLKDKELENFNALFHSATRWHKSQYLRNYIKEYKEHSVKTNSLNKDKKKWIEWAIEKADWYDPFIEKEVKLLDDIDRDTLKSKKKYWY